MKRFHLVLIIIAVLAASWFGFSIFSYLTSEKLVFACAPGDLECLQKARDCREECIPSTFAIEGRT